MVKITNWLRKLDCILLFLEKIAPKNNFYLLKKVEF